MVLNSFKAVIKEGVYFIPCAWHIEKAWNQRLKGDMLAVVKGLRLESDVTVFECDYNAWEEHFMQGDRVRNIWLDLLCYQLWP
jgi:hypothetical protein